MEVKLYYDRKKAKKHLRRDFVRICRVVLWVIGILAICVIPFSLWYSGASRTDDEIATATIIVVVMPILFGLILFFFEVLKPEIIDPDSKYLTYILFECGGRLFSVNGFAGNFYRFEKAGGKFATQGLIKDCEYFERGIVYPSFAEVDIEKADYLSLRPIMGDERYFKGFCNFSIIAELVDETSNTNTMSMISPNQQSPLS